MKKIYTFLFLFLLINLGFSQPDTSHTNSLTVDTLSLIPSTLTAVRDGEFLDPVTFNGHIPKAGDNIIIPPGVNLRISTAINFNNGTEPATTIYNGGSLTFGPKGSLDISSGSVVFGSDGSEINREGREKIPVIKIGNAVFYGGSDTVVEGPVLYPAGIIPEKILNISAVYQKHLNILNWTTIRECNTKSFQIMKSINGSKWDAIALIPASGNTKSVHAYTYIDTMACATCYYRIKIIEQSGRTEYSFIRSVKNIESSDNLSLRH